MNSVIFLTLAASLFLGVLLILIGRRGRKINDHPQCRWCGFDLAGVYPASVTCPECGAGLKREGGVRIGVRKRLMSLIAIGAVLAVLPLAPFAIVLYATSTGVNLNQYKPVWLLLIESRGAAPAQSAAIAQELLSRMQLKSIDAETGKRIAQQALARQENQDLAWSEDWGDILEQARTDKLLSEDDLKRYRQNVIVVSFRARKTVRAGDPLPVEATLKESRVGSSGSFTGQLISAKATLGDQTISRPPAINQQSGMMTPFMSLPRGASIDLLPVAHWWITGSKSNMAFGGAQKQTACWDYRVPKDMPPGRYELTVQLSARIDDSNAFGGFASAFTNSRKPNAKLLTLKTAVEVVAADTPALPSASLSAADEALLQGQLTSMTNVMAYGMPVSRGSRATTSVQVTFNLRDLPAAMAHRVVVVVGGKEQELGQLVTGAAANSTLGGWYAGQDEHTRMLYAAVERLDLKKTKTLDIILRPDPTLAAKMLDPVAVYAGEITLKDFAINDQSQIYSSGFNAATAESSEESPTPETGTAEPEESPQPK